MIPISYTITPSITDHLVAIDAYRRNILLTPLPPKHETRLRWAATVDHISASLTQGDTRVPKPQVIALLLHPSKQPASNEKLVHAYKAALDLIHEEWTANSKPITFAILETLASALFPPRAIKSMFQHEEDNIKRLLTYLQSQTDHPILVAGIAQGQLASSSLFDVSHGIICRLTAALILAKYGYDCRGLLAIDPFWAEEQERYTRAIASIARFGQLTAWLEYYTAVAERAYEELAQKIRQSGNENDVPVATWQLTTREEQIMHRLDSPTSSITNRDVQHSFHVSQVTASRDLTHLSALGLLFTHGKGRSVYYTRA